MSNTDKCAVCRREHGEQEGDRIYILSDMAVIPYINKEQQQERTVGVCSYCRALMPFDFGALIAEVDKGSLSGAASDALVQGLLTRFLTEIWPEESVPSWSVLCAMLNGIGCQTQSGKRWEYHNLAQTCTRLGVDKEMLVGQRLKRTYQERLASLVDNARAWAAQEYAEQAAAAVSVNRNAPPASPSWQPPVPAALPGDMPGGRAIDDV